MTYKITVDKKYIEIDANDEVISFVNNYFDGYYSVEPSNKNGSTEDRIIKIVEMREKPNADEIELIQKSGFKEILIHYNQKAKLYDSGDKKWLFYEKLNHIVSIKDGIIYYYLNTEDDNYLYIPMRIARDVIYAYLLESGFVEIHAASVEFNQTGLLIMGDKGAGKTTLLFQLLKDERVSFISNDKSFLKMQSGELKGYPISINLRRDIVKFVPETVTLFDLEQGNHYQHTEWEEYLHNEKKTFSIGDIRKRLDFSIASSANCNAILMPVNASGTFEEVSVNWKDLCNNIRQTPFLNWISLLIGRKISICLPQFEMLKNIVCIKVYRDCKTNDLLDYIEKKINLKKPNVLFLNPSRRIELITFFEEVCNIHIACYDNLDPCMVVFNTYATRVIKRNIDLEEIIALCEEWKIDLIIPWLESDMLSLFEQRDLLELHGIKLACGDSEGTKKAFNKLKVYEELTRKGIADIASYYNSDQMFDYPIVIKPCVGSGSYGVKIIRNELQFKAFFEPGMLIMKFLSGEEYTVDAFCKDGEALVCLPRKRIKHRAGECLISILQKNNILIEKTKQICKALELDGAINIQFIYDEDTQTFICTDINPRFGGGVVLSIHAGVNFPKLCIDYYLRGEVDCSDYQRINWGEVSTRWLKTEFTKTYSIRNIKNIDFMMQ